MAEPTPIERQAFTWMQGRLIELLLRYDIQRFGGTFAEFIADQATDPLLEQYRRLAVLFYLRDELFESILPRIKRRLSFASPRDTKIEKLPARGRIEWSRTISEAWNRNPGLLPLEVHTQQRRRHFDTPENLLTVATLVEYRQAVQHVLDTEIDRDDMQAIRHPFNEIVDACTRELVFPQFAGLLHAAEEIIAGYAPQTINDLEHAVTEHRIPGHNSAYSDLLDWRHKLTELQLLDRTQSPNAVTMLGANPKHDNALYELWLFYELAAFLESTSAFRWDEASSEQPNAARRYAFGFNWGRESVEYHLTYNREIPIAWHDAPALRSNKNSAPHVRPDFYIKRIDRQRVVDPTNPTQIIWQEPGYLLDAKYYRPQSTPQAASDPIKRMIADLHLTEERHGALLFAFLQAEHSPEDSNDDHAAYDAEQTLIDTPQPTPSEVYQIRPNPTIQHSSPTLNIGLWRIQPRSEISANPHLHRVFTALLDTVHQTLKQPVAIRCHGIFLDQLSATAQGQLASMDALMQRNGSPIATNLDDILICPKPHIAPWRIDLVSLTSDCCQNAALCHINHAMPKPQRLDTLEDVTTTIKSTHTASSHSDAIIDAATKQVRAIVKRYQQFIQPNLNDYLDWIREKLQIDDEFDETPLLNPESRETLALARFIWEQTEQLKAKNFAGPTLLFAGTLETVVRNTIYATLHQHHAALCDASGKELYQTLGTLGNSKGYGGSNYRLLQKYIVDAKHWNPKIAPNQLFEFSAWIDILAKASKIRNRAAHEAIVSKAEYDYFLKLYFGSLSTGYGLLNGLLLAWK